MTWVRDHSVSIKPLRPLPPLLHLPPFDGTGSLNNLPLAIDSFSGTISRWPLTQNTFEVIAQRLETL
jgi:hypothetical protein